MSRHNAWCFTINHPTPTDEFAVQHLFRNAKYGICGHEVGAQGTKHLQGYVRPSSPLSLKAMKKYLCRAHLTAAAGTDEQNRDYCSKDGNLFIQVGEISIGQGTRTDIKEIASKIKSHDITLEEIMFEHPEMYLKYSRSFEKMFNAVMVSRNEKPNVTWLWGLAGTGKTRTATESHQTTYSKDNTIWWDGYTQQEAIIIDDFDNTIPYRTLLRILDRYVYQGQVKGGYVQVNSPFIYITCEHQPAYYWSGNELEQIVRRLTSIQEIKKKL